MSPEPPQDTDRAFRMYRRAVAAYEQCGLFAEARELSYRQLLLKLRCSKELGVPLTHRLELLIHWAIAGFGFRPLRVVGTAAVFVLLFALTYWLIGGVVHNGGAPVTGFWETLYFSGVTFGTIGYGDYLPAPHARMLAMFEGFVGAFTIGLFVAVLVNRLNRS